LSEMEKREYADKELKKLSFSESKSVKAIQ
jgi:hypothetical protein